jgi:hypothetical protein
MKTGRKTAVVCPKSDCFGQQCYCVTKTGSKNLLIWATGPIEAVEKGIVWVMG